MTIPRYERITYRPEGGRARTVRLRDVHDTRDGQILSGVEVDEDGEDTCPDEKWLRQHGASDGSRVHLIEASLVIDRVPLEMDLIYCSLVPKGTATLASAARADD